MLHRPSTSRLEGTTTSWFDGGDAGLWEIEAAKLASSGDYGDYGEALLEQTQVTVRPTSKEALVSDIARGFPRRGRAIDPSR